MFYPLAKPQQQTCFVNDKAWKENNVDLLNDCFFYE